MVPDKHLPRNVASGLQTATTVISPLVCKAFQGNWSINMEQIDHHLCESFHKALQAADI